MNLLIRMFWVFLWDWVPFPVHMNIFINFLNFINLYTCNRKYIHWCLHTFMYIAPVSYHLSVPWSFGQSGPDIYTLYIYIYICIYIYAYIFIYRFVLLFFIYLFIYIYIYIFIYLYNYKNILYIFMYSEVLAD